VPLPDAHGGCIRIETGEGSAAGKEEEQGSLQGQFFSSTCTHNGCFPKGSGSLFLTCFFSARAALAVSPRLRWLQSVRAPEPGARVGGLGLFVAPEQRKLLALLITEESWNNQTWRA